MNKSTCERILLDMDQAGAYHGDMSNHYPTQVNVFVEQQSGVSDLIDAFGTLVKWFLYAMVAWVIFVLAIYVVTEHTLVLAVLVFPALLLVRRVRRQRRNRAAQLIAYDHLREAKAEYYRQWREDLRKQREE